MVTFSVLIFSLTNLNLTYVIHFHINFNLGQIRVVVTKNLLRNVAPLYEITSL